MLDKLLVFAAAEVLDGAGKAVKKVGEKVNDIQKDTFEKYVEHNTKKADVYEQVWLEESSVIKNGFISDKECRKYCIYNMDDQLIYEAISGNIEKRVSLNIKDCNGNAIASVSETGSILDKLNAEYEISVNGISTYTAKIDYNCLKPAIELKEKDWKLCYDIGGVKNIVDNHDTVIAEVNKKIGKRRLISIYSKEKRLCILLILVGIINGVRFVHLQ